MGHTHTYTHKITHTYVHTHPAAIDGCKELESLQVKEGECDNGGDKGEAGAVEGKDVERRLKRLERVMKCFENVSEGRT